jgi:hypothetical protein
VSSHRPALPWSAVADHINTKLAGDAKPWFSARLRSAERAFVDLTRLPDEVLEMAPKRSRRRAAIGGDAWRDNAIKVIAHFKRQHPAITNRRLAALLDRELGPPKSAMRWSESTVRVHLREARQGGLC